MSNFENSLFIEIEGHLFKKASSGYIPRKHDLFQEYLANSYRNLKLFSKSGTDPFPIQSFRSTNGNATNKK